METNKVIMKLRNVLDLIMIAQNTLEEAKEVIKDDKNYWITEELYDELKEIWNRTYNIWFEYNQLE